MGPDLVFALGSTLGLLLVGYGVGSVMERRHLARLLTREQRLLDFPAVTFEGLPSDWTPERAALVAGNVVISVDYFKRFVAGLRAVFGGRIRTYEPLMDRARREAIVRMLEQARGAGYDAVVNIRLETSRLANSEYGGNQAISGVEVLAYGTAIGLAQRS